MPAVKPEQLKVTGTKILVRKYERPEKVGSILLAPNWRQDNSRALWEVVKSSEGADEYLGYRLKPNWILVTPPNRGVYTSQVELTAKDGSSVEAFFILAQEVAQVKAWDSEEGEEDEAEG